MKVALAGDRTGFRLKKVIKDFLKGENIEYKDLGVYSEESCDYIDWGEKAIEKIIGGELDRDILFCGTGLAISMLANKFPGVRAALCYGLYAARQFREHNDANILVLTGRMTGGGLARKIVRE